MKFKFFSQLVIFSFLMFSASACSNQKNNVPTAAAADSLEDLQGSTVVRAGNLQGANGYSSMGTVKLVVSADLQTYSLIFENLRSSNGPDLKVYLATDSSSSTFINLGDLKSVAGTLRYDFPAGQFNPNLDTAVIWCQQFSVLFGFANLNVP